MEVDRNKHSAHDVKDFIREKTGIPCESMILEGLRENP